MPVFAVKDDKFNSNKIGYLIDYSLQKEFTHESYKHRAYIS